MKNPKPYFPFFIMILSIIFATGSTLSAGWIEDINYGLGNLCFNFGGHGGNYINLQGSSFIAYILSDSIIIFDIDSMRFRDGITLSYSVSQNKGFAIPTKSGWYIYYSYNVSQSTSNNSKIHIEKDGHFGENKPLEGKALSSSSFIGDPDRSQVWFFDEKILLFDAIKDSWTEYDYPKNWDSDFKGLTIFSVLARNSVIGISYGNTMQDYQAFVLDVETYQSKIIQADKGFFQNVDDIVEWKNHAGKFLILKEDEIYSYDSGAGIIELLMNEVEILSDLSMQNETGQYLYDLDSRAINVIDLLNKTVKTHELLLNDNFSILSSGSLDSKRNKIITFIGVGIYRDKSEFMIIDLDDFSLNYFENKHEISQNSYFLEDEKLLFTSYPYFYFANVDSGEFYNSPSIFYDTISWNIIDDLNKPILIDNSMGDDFIRLHPDNNREMNNMGVVPELVCQFPDCKDAIIGELIWVETGTSTYTYYNYKKYNFDDKSIKTIHIPFECHEFFTDSNNNQIIGTAFTSYYNLVEFIAPDNFVTTWFAPEELNLDFYKKVFDHENSILWVLFENLDNGDYHFYKLSSKEKSLLDSFTLEGETFKEIRNIVTDPEDKFLYFIDETNENTARELIVLDINDRIIKKRVTLQEGVQNGITTIIVIPGIIPVSEKDRLFIWDNYGAWSIDTNSWEILYGELVDTPQNIESSTVIQGVYLENENQVLVVDRGKRVLYVDLDAGNVIKEIPLSMYFSKLHITKEKDKILFLDSNNSIIHTLFLDPAWEKPATITPRTNYIQLGEGDNAKFSINIKNEYDFSQDVTAYIWLYAPIGVKLYFNGYGMTTDVDGIPLTLPANLDITGDILTFTMPAGVPEGFYNFNAVLINENGDRGPVGTWNFYVKD